MPNRRLVFAFIALWFTTANPFIAQLAQVAGH